MDNNTKKNEFKLQKNLFEVSRITRRCRRTTKKKLQNVDPENEDTAVLDESRAQNDPNPRKRLCNPTVNGVRDPNITVRTGKRFGINATGIQGINCQSAIYFNHKNNAVNFAINLCEYSILRFENSHINKIICDAIYDPNLDETKIKLDLLAPIITKKEYKVLIDNEDRLSEWQNYLIFCYGILLYMIHYF